MKVCLISCSVIADDPRVRRQGDALDQAGHDVVAIGWSGAASPPPSWKVVETRRPSRSLVAKALLAARLLLLGRAPGSRQRVFWSLPGNDSMLRLALAQGADLYLANDWRALPIAERAARTHGVAYAYDSHEFGPEEFADRLVWRTVFSGFVDAIERSLVPGASFTTTVSEGIAQAMRDRYSLAATPLVVRSVPQYAEHPLQPPGDRITVLYHGQFQYNRHLDTLIESVPLWRPEFDLVLRGYGPQAVERRLRHTITKRGVGSRVTILPPVPMVDLVHTANAADIGVSVLPAHTRQLEFSLPNKFFEYVMAGLAVCVSGSPEMARLVERLDLGHIVDEVTPSGIAAAINSFTAESIVNYKRHALSAARELCWERESGILVGAVGATLDRSSGTAHWGEAEEREAP